MATHTTIENASGYTLYALIEWQIIEFERGIDAYFEELDKAEDVHTCPDCIRPWQLCECKPF